ncbi:MAG: sigma-54-dependent transcriptional regulator [Thermohalobaculum sp.]
MDHKVLIVDDDPQQRRYLSAILSSLGYGVATASGGIAAVEQLSAARQHGISLALLDLHMPDLDGIKVLEQVRAAGASLPIVVLTADGSVARAVDAMRAGASDFIVKPVAPERLDVSIRNALAISSLSREVQRLNRQAENRLSFEDLVAVSPAIRSSIALARRVARSDIPVLIEGESGTGKEVFARAIHGTSERAGAAFVAVNCGALPAALVESILFGHEKGAFTGATERHRGKFQEASGGTLFLDEIGELPLDAQVKLLRAIQTGEVDPVGGSGPVKVDIRLISATNRDLQAMIAEGRFREDLYYRIGVFPLALPPLRERREDLPGLARMFLARSTAAEGIAIDNFSTAAMEAISRGSWPGNVRQLQSTIQRAVILADGPVIRPQDLHGLDLHGPDSAAATSVPTRANWAANGAAGTHPESGSDSVANPFLTGDGHIRRLLDIEAEAIARALTLYRGRMAETARRLGIGRSTLYRKIDDLQLDRHGG